MTSRSLKFAVLSVLLTAFAAVADLVSDVRGTLSQDNIRVAIQQIQIERGKQRETPQTVLALSWVARGAFSAKRYSEAEAYSRDIYRRATALLKKRPLDREPDLPLALGAAIEVQAQAMTAQGFRGEAVGYLADELRKYSNTSIHTRIQKNILLLSLEGKPAPVLRAVSLPAGKPALLFFWAHWCGDCRAEAPILARLKKEYGPKGLVFIGPTQKYGYVAGGIDAPPSVELRFIEQIRQQHYAAVVNPPVAVSSEKFENYGVSTTPTPVLVARRGIARRYHSGGMTYDELKTAIEDVLRTS